MEEMDRLVESHQDNDGIREFDNPLPNWFLYLFYGCIAFAFLYFAYFAGHAWGVAKAAGTGYNLSSSGAMFAASVREAEKESGGSQVADLHGEKLLALLKAPASISRGETVFKTTCAPCHGGNGQGVVGPNLTDGYWLHGGRPDSIVESISHGYPAKGMPSWKGVLGPEKVRLVAAYVLSLRGQPVPNPKAPQGVLEE
jgi:cytochrome c oxidase cbb3-type subunit 3